VAACFTRECHLLSHLPMAKLSEPKRQKSKSKTKSPSTKARTDHSGNSVGTRKTVPRLLRIAELIRQGNCPPKEQVALMFETSTRTIERDFEYLRNQCRMEFTFDRAKNVHRATTYTVGLPAMQMTIPEIMALLIGRRAMQTHQGAGLYEHATSAIEKITTFMTDADVEEYKALDRMVSYCGAPSAGKIDVTIFPALAQGLVDAVELELFYLKSKADEPEWRRVRPLHLYFRSNRWYLYAQDHLRGLQGRFYMLSRIKEVRNLGEPFERPADFDPEKVIANTIGLYSGGEPEPIRLRIDRDAARWFDENPLHLTQEIDSNPDGTYELTAEVAINPELEGHLLRWGTQIEILEPPRLKDTILQIARAIVARDR
jgi:predicted DNA-binding transcriptional regulator YafY